MPYAGANKQKQQPGGAPGWYQHDEASGGAAKKGEAAPAAAASPVRVSSKTHTVDAQENLVRNRGECLLLCLHLQLHENIVLQNRLYITTGYLKLHSI